VRANPIPVLVARMATINNTFFILRRKIRMNNKTRWGSACSLARITWPGSMGLISASQSCRTSEAPQVAVTVASSRYGKCQFAGAKIMPFCEISKSIDNYFSDLSINSYINIYYMYARENFVPEKFASVQKKMYLCAAISKKTKRFAFLWIRHKYITASEIVFPKS
jgi:hypothetical protein